MGLLIAAIVFFVFYLFVGFKVEQTAQYRDGTGWMWFVLLGALWLFLNPIFGALQGDWWIVHPDWTKNSSVLWIVSAFGGLAGLFLSDIHKKTG